MIENSAHFDISCEGHNIKYKYYRNSDLLTIFEIESMRICADTNDDMEKSNKKKVG